MSQDESVRFDTEESLSEPVDVLLIDDDEQWTRATAWHLERARDDFEVETEHSFETGYERYETLSPDCVVCDYQLGDGNGLDFLDRVRDDAPDLPFVLVTGRGDEGVASEAIRRDTTEYIPKENDDEESELLATRVENAVRAYRYEKALERNRRSKDALIDLIKNNDDGLAVCRGICSVLVEEYGYGFAWVGAVRQDAGGTEITPLTSAGGGTVASKVLGETVPVDGKTVAEDRPAVDAVVRDETAVVLWGDDNEGFREGFDSGIGVPVHHEGACRGVLCVYVSGEPRFDRKVEEIIEDFAETTGRFLHDAEAREPSERRTRVEIGVSDNSVPLVRLGSRLPDGSRIEVPSTVPRDDETVCLVCVEGVSADEASSAVEKEPSVEPLSVEASSPTVRFEAVVSETTPEGLLAEKGVRVHRTVVEDGVATVSATVPSGVSVSVVDEALRSNYTDASVESVVNQRTTESLKTTSSFLRQLTDKQRDALKHAYYGGFFERPRETNTTELAERLGVARQTVTHHLRAAQRKVFGELFE